MKRTIERILAWLGIITQLFILLGLGIGTMFGGTSEVQKKLKDRLKNRRLQIQPWTHRHICLSYYHQYLKLDLFMV